MGLKHIFFTGDFKVGKTTALRKIIKGYKESEVVSLITESHKDYGNSNTVFLNGIEAGRLKDHKVLYAYPEVFNTAGVNALEIKPDTKIIAIDEIGILEKDADRFCDRVLKLLEQTDIQVVGVLRKSADTPLAEKIRHHKNVELIEIVK